MSFVPDQKPSSLLSLSCVLSLLGLGLHIRCCHHFLDSGPRLGTVLTPAGVQRCLTVLTAKKCLSGEKPLTPHPISQLCREPFGHAFSVCGSWLVPRGEQGTPVLVQNLCCLLFRSSNLFSGTNHSLISVFMERQEPEKNDKKKGPGQYFCRVL